MDRSKSFNLLLCWWLGCLRDVVISRRVMSPDSFQFTNIETFWNGQDLLELSSKFFTMKDNPPGKEYFPSRTQMTSSVKQYNRLYHLSTPFHCGLSGRQVPIFFLFFPIFLSILLFFLFFSNFLLFFLFFSHFTYNKQIFVRDLNILSLFKYVVYRVH